MMREEDDYLVVERDAEAEEEAESMNGTEETSSEEEEELELGLGLGLGLSLRVKKNKVTSSTSGQNKEDKIHKNKWGRILIAKDFPTACSRASPISSSSSSSSSVSSSSPAANRVPDPRSANPPSQLVVGWPPIRAFRFNSLINSAKDNSASETDEKKNKKKSAADQCIHSNKQQQQEIKSAAAAAALRFVKVKMDGDPIGRKVDLSAHHSYDTLAVALEIMFRKPTIELCSSAHCIKASKWLDGSSEFALTYQDRWGLDAAWRCSMGDVLGHCQETQNHQDLRC